MTELEKLRSLLSEARDALGLWASKWSNEAADLLPRIDAALATPVERTPVDVLVSRLGALATECDRLRGEVKQLRWAQEMGCENTPTRGCECPGCETARERAERGEGGP